jgi:adenylate cyclase class 2
MKEFEAKFFVRNLDVVRERMLALGGTIKQGRHLERNWRFDRPDRSLSESGIVLRLREDDNITLTLKRPLGSIEERREIELHLDDLAAARALLEDLGYQVFARYEKYRETLSYEDNTLMLDELPFGEFVEIEGPSLGSVQAHAGQLGLNWSHRVQLSYLDLFELIRSRLDLQAHEATFAAFDEVHEVEPSLIDLVDAISPLERES